MQTYRPPVALVTRAQTSAAELAALMQGARALQVTTGAGGIRPLLRGCRIGLLIGGDATADADVALFDRAAAGLGAHVAHIRPRLTASSDPEVQARTARMLGRLYDAVLCHGIATEIVQRLAAEAGVPVYDGIAAPRHLLADIAGHCAATIAAGDRCRFVLQAVLLRALG